LSTQTYSRIKDLHWAEHLNPPHGGKLTDLIVTPDRRTDLRAESIHWPSWDLSERQMCDLELLLNGGFSPLRGFMGPADYNSVCSSMRLSDGTVWPIPITLDVPEEFAASLRPKGRLALRDPEGVMLAALEVEEIWRADKLAEAEMVFGTGNPEHPGVAYLLTKTHSHYVTGRLEGLQLPTHYDFRPLRLTPAELRAQFGQRGWKRVVAFQTRNPMHRAHF